MRWVSVCCFWWARGPVLARMLQSKIYHADWICLLNEQGTILAFNAKVSGVMGGNHAAVPQARVFKARSCKKLLSLVGPGVLDVVSFHRGSLKLAFCCLWNLVMNQDVRTPFAKPSAERSGSVVGVSCAYCLLAAKDAGAFELADSVSGVVRRPSPMTGLAKLFFMLLHGEMAV